MNGYAARLAKPVTRTRIEDLRRSAGESLTCDAAVALVMAVVTALIAQPARSLLQNA